jgi:hypothetical protein
VPAARVASMLHAADAIKFAGDRVEPPAAESLGAEAAQIVLAVHAADMAGEPA